MWRCLAELHAPAVSGYTNVCHCYADYDSSTAAEGVAAVWWHWISDIIRDLV